MLKSVKLSHDSRHHVQSQRNPIVHSLKMKLRARPQPKEIQKRETARKCNCCLRRKPVIFCSDDHGLCRKCIENESNEQLAGNRKSVIHQSQLNCVGMGCGLKLSESQVREALGGKKYGIRTSRLRELFSFVLTEKCPGCFQPAKPGKVIRKLDKRLLCDLIQCDNAACGIKYCAQCGDQTDVHHRCKDQKLYNQWTTLLKSSVPCPYCRRFIQKSWGCDHISCHCGCHFCYNCGSAYYDEKQTLIHNLCNCCLHRHRYGMVQ